MNLIPFLFGAAAVSLVTTDTGRNVSESTGNAIIAMAKKAIAEAEKSIAEITTQSRTETSDENYKEGK